MDIDYSDVQSSSAGLSPGCSVGPARGPELVERRCSGSTAKGRVGKQSMMVWLYTTKLLTDLIREGTHLVITHNKYYHKKLLGNE